MATNSLLVSLCVLLAARPAVAQIYGGGYGNGYNGYSGTSYGVRIGVGVGVAVVVALIVLAVGLLMRKRRARAFKQQYPVQPNTTQTGTAYGGQGGSGYDQGGAAMQQPLPYNGGGDKPESGQQAPPYSNYSQGQAYNGYNASQQQQQPYYPPPAAPPLAHQSSTPYYAPPAGPPPGQYDPTNVKGA